MAFYGGFLDDAVYAKGKEVTAAGEVIEKRKMPLGEIEYTYPVISVKEIHLWPERAKLRYAPYPGPLWGPYWYGPWYDPWYFPRYHPYGRRRR